MRTCLTVALLALLGLGGPLCRYACASAAPVAGAEAWQAAQESGSDHGCHNTVTPGPESQGERCAGCPGCEDDDAPLLTKAPDSPTPLLLVAARPVWGPSLPPERSPGARAGSTRAIPPPRDLLLQKSTLLL